MLKDEVKKTSYKHLEYKCIMYYDYAYFHNWKKYLQTIVCVIIIY